MTIPLMLVLSLLIFDQTTKGNEYYNSQQYPEALSAYEEAEVEHPEAPEVHYNKGNALYRQDMFNEAAASYQQA
ncbi:MAG: tetratricopeptide repeat protein, partial [Candidatus Latescibacteria bacterium]|nr:tetratricopeptide repeat protein [Candidatus Latescibacterota bacterium]